MKTPLSFVILALTLTSVLAVTPTPSVAAGVDNPGAPVAPVSTPSSAPVAPAAPAPSVAPTSSTLPSAGFASGRYEALWVKSPFAVATSEAVGEESPDYFLVGVANQDGVFYASVIERQNQEHFLLTSDHSVRGLTLKSINRSRDGQNTYAQVMKDGQPLTLKMEQAPAGAVTATNMGMPGVMQMPNTMAPQIQMPGGAPGFPNNGSARPFTRFHRPPIRLPQSQPAPAPSTPPPPPPPPQ